MSYTYRFIKIEKKEPVQLNLRCYHYALIDKFGNAEIYSKRYYPKEEVLYYKSSIDKRLIDSVLIAETRNEKILAEKRYSRDKLIIYDGPSLKIKINYSNKTSKFVGFINDKNKENCHFIALFNYVDSIYQTKNHEFIGDTTYIERRRQEFMKYTMKEDTSNPRFALPPPPAPEELQIKYVIPKEK